MKQPDPPPVRQFADRATQMLLESAANVADLMRIVDPGLVDDLDFSRAVRENRVLVDEALAENEMDVLYHVPFRDVDGEVLVYVLVEHQSATDRLMALKLLRYMVRVWEQQWRKWRDDKVPRERCELHLVVGMVFYTGSASWTQPIALETAMRVPESLQEFVPRFRTLFLDLKSTPPDALQSSALACALRVFQAEDAPLVDLARVLAKAVEELEAPSEEHHGEWHRAMTFLLQLIRHRRPAAEGPALGKIMTGASKKQEEVEKMISWAEADYRRGIEEGRIRQALMLERLVRKKFPMLSGEVSEKIRALPPERIDEVFDRALSANEVTDLGLMDDLLG